MKLCEHIPAAGTPMFYYPALARVVGGSNPALFLCRLIQWHGHQSDPNGGIYKSREDMEAETGLTGKEQVTARKRLKACGVLTEYYERYRHRMYYYVNFERLAVLLATVSIANDKLVGVVERVIKHFSTTVIKKTAGGWVRRAMENWRQYGPDEVEEHVAAHRTNRAKEQACPAWRPRPDSAPLNAEEFRGKEYIEAASEDEVHDLEAAILTKYSSRPQSAELLAHLQATAIEENRSWWQAVARHVGERERPIQHSSMGTAA